MTPITEGPATEQYGRLYLHRHTVLEIVLHTHRTGMDDIPSDHEVQMRVRGMKVKELRQELERARLDSRGTSPLFRLVEGMLICIRRQGSSVATG